MPIKAVIEEDHIPRNKFQLLIAGMPTITFTYVSGIEYELDTVELPDRTKSPGGNAKPVEFTARMPMHHTSERVAMEAWFEECQDPISSTAKKAGTLVTQSGTGQTTVSQSMTGLFLTKKTLPELDYTNEGEMAEIEWTLSADTVLPI
jgi:hypothetical protein